MDKERNVPVEMVSYPTQQLWLVASGNPQLVPQTHNVHQDLSVTTNSANLFVIVMETVFQMSCVSKMFAKKFVEKMGIVIPMKFVKVFNASRDVEETVIVQQGKLVKTISASVNNKNLNSN